MTDLIFYAQYIASKQGKTGLTVTIDIWRVTRSSAATSEIVAGGSAVELGDGLYLYRLTGADPVLYDYLATFKTADSTVDTQHIPALWTSWSLAYASELARLDDTITSRLAAASYSAPPSAASIADAVWDEPLTAATHNVATSSGRRLRQLSSAVIIDGTAVSATTNTIVLDVDASAVDGAYDPAIICIVGGAGAGQSRLIYQYTGATKTAVVDRDWKTTPDGTSTYIVISDPGREHVNEGLIRAATSTTAQLNANASSIDEAYTGQIVFVRSGTGADQARRVQAYDGDTQTVTVEAWDTTPDTTSAYVMLPTGLWEAHEVWGYASRTLTQSAASSQLTTTAAVERARGDTWAISLTGLGANTGYVSLDFSIKNSTDDADTAAIVRVRKNASGVGDGLLYLNGAAPVAPVVAADGSITVNSATAITVALAARATDDLTPGWYVYDVQLITAAAVTTLASGTFEITADVTRAVS